MKGATFDQEVNAFDKAVSIHAPNEGSDKGRWKLFHVVIVSIHAPNEGSDCTSPVLRLVQGVSIHAPNEGSDVTV